MVVSRDDEMRALAQEELQAACSLSWREAARIVPWGDSYRGVAPSGDEVEFERRYLWAHGEGGEILVEVEVRCCPDREDCGARASAVIAPEAAA